MTAFTPKRIASEGWGEKLLQARRFRGLRLEDVSQRLNIRPEYLAALENERWEDLPAGLYGKNYLKEYARFLRLDVKAILRDWEGRFSIQSEDPFEHKVLARRKLLIFPRLIRNLAIGAAVCICLLYLLFYFKRLLLPPDLTLYSPSGNLATSSMSVLVSGKTDREAEVKINGEVVLDNAGGVFKQTINLRQGLNNIVVTAKKKYSRQQSLTRQVLVNP